MKDDFNGIEEYPNSFEREYCEEIIRHFDVMARNQVTYSQNSVKVNQDERIVFDWAHTQHTSMTIIYVIIFTKIARSIYT